ncbi:BQ5605_C033g11185 [Microbotryum silenes-dioicae]|uniref:BQ5605_C033g11185 protein n=1 Tax=Microbotryum silenes-dioicae TaxID=796604 RepID=A0A2X0MKR9_9BASI|nr:BQ5605_C033g11185 [Microbotryum silenes-dioicae]
MGARLADSMIESNVRIGSRFTYFILTPSLVAKDRLRVKASPQVNPVAHGPFDYMCN